VAVNEEQFVTNGRSALLKMLGLGCVEVCSTLSGSTKALASARGPDSKSGLDTVKEHALGAVLSYGYGHSTASKCARAAAQAQSGSMKVKDRASNPIQGHWRVKQRQEVGVDQRDQPLLQDVEMGGGNTPTGAGALEAGQGMRGHGRTSLH
jgi:hypothetical protein